MRILAEWRANALILFVISTLYQGLALLGVVDVAASEASRILFGVGEMLLIIALLGNGWLIKRHWQGQQPGSLAASTARLMFYSLAICVLGDLVNRNFGGELFGHGPLIAHAYLVDSIWAFAPGYALFLLASWRVARQAGVCPKRMTGIAIGAAALGLIGYIDLPAPGTSGYVLALTGGYAALITVVGAAAIWLVLALGWSRAWPVAIGAVLATLADALIGHFWLFREGYFPTVSHLNWIIYFGSQALLQQLPLQLPATHTDAQSA